MNISRDSETIIVVDTTVFIVWIFDITDAVQLKI